jgi:DNA modification methylase
LEAAVRAAIESVRLIEGDAREFLPIEADVCITDPPYAVDKRGNMLGQLAANYHDKGTHTRGYADHDKVQFGALMVPVFAGVRDSLPPGATMVAFCGNRTFHQMATFAEEAGFQMLDVLVFPKRKTFARSTSTLVPCHEIAMFMRKPGGTRLINPARNIGNVFDLVRPGKGESAHPTTKAQSWMEAIVEVFTEPGEHILDPFAGSGSTLVAAKKLGRLATGIELVPEYAEIARGEDRVTSHECEFRACPCDIPHRVCRICGGIQ